jgi:hypothetical protein
MTFESLQGKGSFVFSKLSLPALRPTRLLCNEYQSSFLGLKSPERDVDHSTPSNTEVKKSIAKPLRHLYDFTAWTGTTFVLLYEKVTQFVKFAPG